MHPSGIETKRNMLQQDGCTGDAVFLVFKSVRLWGNLPCMSVTHSFPGDVYRPATLSQVHCMVSLHI